MDGCKGTYTQGFFDQYRNLPGIGVYMNTRTTSEIAMQCGEFGIGLWGSMGLGKKDIFKRHSGNEIDVWIDWRRRWNEMFGTYIVESWIRLSYFNNDFQGSGIDYMRDDQWIVDAEVSLPEAFYFTPAIRWRYFGAIGAASPHRGSFWWLILRKTYPMRISSFDLLLRLEGNVAFSDGALGRNGKRSGLVYGRLMAALEIPITETISVIPNGMLQIANQYGEPPFGYYSEKRIIPSYGIMIRKKF